MCTRTIIVHLYKRSRGKINKFLIIVTFCESVSYVSGVDGRGVLVWIVGFWRLAQISEGACVGMAGD